MVEFWIIITMLCLLTVTGGALLALRQFYRSLDNSRQEREAWQQAQEGRQRTWEVRQGKHILDAEKKLADQLKDARREWRDWNAQIHQDHQEWRNSVDLEKALARLPHVEQVELAPQAPGGRLQPKDWRPAAFYKADLRGRDLSYRYMVRADLRETQLMEANLYMADLAGASLTGADLQQTNLIGANLSGADLRGANLSGANLMVADLHNTVLHGANLTGARNLTPEQLQTAIYDSTTLIDSTIDITLPRISSVLTTSPKLLSTTLTDSQQANNLTNTPDAPKVSVNSSDVEQPAQSETPASIAETAANIDKDADPALFAETSVNIDKGKDAALLAETGTNAPVLAPPQANEAQTPVTEQSAETPVLPGENEESLPENPTSTGEINKKRSTSKKRPNKAKQFATASTPTFTGTPDEISIDKTSSSHERVVAEEHEELDEEQILPSKIIQWPARAPKTSPLSNAGEQNNGDRPQKNRGNNLTASFNEAADNPPNQRAQAN